MLFDAHPTANAADCAAPTQPSRSAASRHSSTVDSTARVRHHFGLRQRCRLRQQYDGRRFEANHAWNAIKLDGAWELIDTTWAAGHVDNDIRNFTKSYEKSWWCTEPATFLYKHFPMRCKGGESAKGGDASAWQLMDHPVSKAEFAEMPTVRPRFSSYDLGSTRASISNARLVKHRSTEPLKLQVQCPTTIALIAGVEQQSDDGAQAKDSWSLQRELIGSINVVLYVTFPSNGKFVVRLYGKPETRSGSFDLLHSVLVNVTAATSGGATFIVGLLGLEGRDALKEAGGQEGQEQEVQGEQNEEQSAHQIDGQIERQHPRGRQTQGEDEEEEDRQAKSEEEARRRP